MPCRYPYTQTMRRAMRKAYKKHKNIESLVQEFDIKPSDLSSWNLPEGYFTQSILKINVQSNYSSKKDT